MGGAEILAAVLSAAAMVTVGLMTYKSSRKSAKETARIAERKSDLDEIRGLAEQQRGLVSSLQLEVARLRTEGLEDRQRIEHLEEDNETKTGQLSLLRRQVETLTAQLRDKDELIKDLLKWMREAVTVFRLHNVPHPPMPLRFRNEDF